MMKLDQVIFDSRITRDAIVGEKEVKKYLSLWGSNYYPRVTGKSRNDDG